jgi:enamine deaminase RidA (YjgF/YER057c/UK114 family)
MSAVEKRLKEMGIEIPGVPKPLAAYVPGVTAGNLVFTSGQIPAKGGEVRRGKLGAGVSLEEGYEAAKICAINCLAVIKSQIGDLDRVEQVVKLVGYVNSAPDFNEQPKVINGASELMVKAFGAAGAHSRSAVGVAALPFGAVCEVEAIVKIKE